MSREDDAPSEDGAPRTPRWLADALDTEAARHLPDSRRIRAGLRERTEAARQPKRRRRLAGAPAGVVAGVLCTAMVFAVTAGYEHDRSGPSPSPALIAGPGPSTSPGEHIVTASGTVAASSRTGWSQEDIGVSFTEPIAGFQLSVKVSLESAGASAGYLSTYDASLFDVTVDAQDHALVYKFDLKPGKTLPPGPSQFAVRFTYQLGHNPSHDTYYVSVYTDKAHGRVSAVAQGAF